MPEPLTAAILARAPTSDPKANAEHIGAALDQAALGHARLLLTSECALIGYPGGPRADLMDVDWPLIARLERELGRAADACGITLVLGSASPTGPSGNGPSGRAGITNDAVVLTGRTPAIRHRKRCLTPNDRLHFIADDSRTPTTLQVDDWSLALSICFEVRFGAFWAQQAASGADGFLHLAHMAGVDVDPGVKAEVLTGLYASRAAEWATPLLLANSAGPDRWLDSGAWDARGVKIASLGEGLLLTRMRSRGEHQAWYSSLREEALTRATMR